MLLHNVGRIVTGEATSGKQLSVSADMRYDDGMCIGPSRLQKFLLIVVNLLAVLVLSGGCRRSGSNVLDETPHSENLVTSDPVLAITLQADIHTTAQYVATLPLAPTTTPAPLPTYEVSEAVGTPPAQRRGVCDVPEGYTLHDREGFCISAPEAWSALNVDGGAALTLHTTPDQVVTLRPDWALSTGVCQVTVYIAAENSAEEHLAVRHVEFAARTDLQSLTPVVMQSLGNLLLPGFAWETQDGASGGIYADLIDMNRLLHISLGGAQCPFDQIIPVVETLRFDQ